MASGQAAAAAPARIPNKSDDEAAMRQVDVPTFSSLGGSSSDHAAGGGKKKILIAAAVLVAGAIGYIGWTKMQTATGTPAAQRQTAPIQIQQPVPVAVPPSATSAQNMASTAGTPQSAGSASAFPVGKAPDVTLSATEAHTSAAKKATSVVASNTVVRNPSEEQTPALIVVRSEASKPAPPPPAPEEPAQPPALASLGTPSNTEDQAISGFMSTTAVNLPRPAQKLKVSQGVSQGLLIKSVPPEYPQQARQMHIQGAVELLAYIGKDGSITGVKLIKGDSVLSRAAMDAVKQWKYKPYYLNDQPVEIQTQITVNFKLP